MALMIAAQCLTPQPDNAKAAVDRPGSERRVRALPVNSLFSLRAHAAKILPRAHHLEHCYSAQNAAIGTGCSKVL
ncbi:hypothetical protein [Shimia sediminis]|uniref:hypothetical protein n=1 Tax=Shimia sediminis TaxID=2497945 RepID=UPI000F8EE87B|nr:hypothetical protein [Shimia sediminis]